MDVRIVGVGLPGRVFGDPRPGGCRYENVHVGVQRGKDVVDLFPGDAAEAVWDLHVDVVRTDAGTDFRGPHVQGRRGDRFLYLSWVTVDGDGRFQMFRRAKLMLGALDEELVRAAGGAGQRLTARLRLTGGDGGPRCAAVRPPGIDWTVAPA